MAVHPIVRYMIICEDWHPDPGNAHRLSVEGLLLHIRSLEAPPYPLLYPEFCILLLLTDGRGQALAEIRCVFEAPNAVIFRTPARTVVLGSNPLAVTGAVLRIRDCIFPAAGFYRVEFWYDGVKLAEQSLLLT